MEQKPSDQKPEVCIADYLWPVVLGSGVAIGAGIGAAKTASVQG